MNFFINPQCIIGHENASIEQFSIGNALRAATIPVKGRLAKILILIVLINE